MKKWLMILLIGLFVSNVYAKTCPPVEGLDPYYPPAGWKVLVEPMVPGQKYDFGAAIHSLNGAFFYKHTICVYESCPSPWCPFFKLISDDEFEFPNSKQPPWDGNSQWRFMLVCYPPDHNPATCEFR